MAFNIGRKIVQAFANSYANQTGDERFRDADSMEYIDLIKQTRGVEEETRNLQREALLNEEVANQYTEKGRRASMFAENNNEISNSGSRGMLSGGTGFAKLRRKVLGTTEKLVNSDKLGG